MTQPVVLLKWEKRLFSLGSLCLVALPIHDIFNWFFLGTPLIVWKQILALTLFVFFAKHLYAKYSYAPPGRTAIKSLLAIVLISTIVSTASSLIQGMSAHRILYAIIAYCGFIGALGYAQSVYTLRKFNSVYELVAIMALICCCGLIMDYFTGYLDFLPRASDIGIDEQLHGDHLRRASFLFGTSTIALPYISFGIVASLFLRQDRTRIIHALYAPILLCVAPFAIFLTGSRSQLYLLLLLYFFLFLIFFRSLLSPKVIIYGAAVVIALSNLNSINFVSYGQISTLLERYETGYEANAESNDVRFDGWGKGARLITDFDINSITGIGIGSSLGMVNDGHRITGHYESSFFQSFSEAGIFGLIIRYAPFVYAVFLLLTVKNKTTKHLLLGAWFIVYFLSVFSAPTAGAYHTQFVYFFATGLTILLTKSSVYRESFKFKAH